MLRIPSYTDNTEHTGKIVLIHESRKNSSPLGRGKIIGFKVCGTGDEFIKLWIIEPEDLTDAALRIWTIDEKELITCLESEISENPLPPLAQQNPSPARTQSLINFC